MGIMAAFFRRLFILARQSFCHLCKPLAIGLLSTWKELQSLRHPPPQRVKKYHARTRWHCPICERRRRRKDVSDCKKRRPISFPVNVSLPAVGCRFPANPASKSGESRNIEPRALGI